MFIRKKDTVEFLVSYPGNVYVETISGPTIGEISNMLIIVPYFLRSHKGVIWSDESTSRYYNNYINIPYNKNKRKITDLNLISPYPNKIKIGPCTLPIINPELELVKWHQFFPFKGSLEEAANLLKAYDNIFKYSKEYNENCSWNLIVLVNWDSVFFLKNGVYEYVF